MQDTPPRPVPGELLRRIRRIEIKTRKAVLDTLAGQYHSVFKGRGMAFSEVRPYQPGDEIRAIDWNVTARMGEPFVKVFQEERELSVMLLVDRSASEDVGALPQTRAEVAAEVAALVAFSAIENGDRVGLCLFTDRIERFVPPRKGKKHGLRVISEVLNAAPAGRGTDLAGVLEFLHRVMRRRTVAFVLSDFIAGGGRDYTRALAVAARRHDVIPVVLCDPLGESLPEEGLLAIEDPESGEQRLVDALDGGVRAFWEKAVGEARLQRERAFARLRLDWLSLSSGDDHAAVLESFFRRREKGARRRAG